MSNFHVDLYGNDEYSLASCKFVLTIIEMNMYYLLNANLTAYFD